MSRFVELAPDDYSKTAFDTFSPDGGFGIDNARAMMWFSQLSYEAYQPAQPATIQAVGQTSWRFTNVTPFREHAIGVSASYDTCGIIGERPGAIVLAFAGTDPGEWETVATDFNLRLGLQGLVHVGFQAATEAVKAEIQQAVDLSRSSQKPLFITGHSLGGAVAVLAADRAVALGGNPKAVYVFGMPRVGDAQFHARYTASLGDKTYRFVHGLDVVARVPPSSLGFRHVGHVLQCASGGKFDGTAALAPLDSDDPAFASELVGSLTSGIRALTTGNIFSPIGPGEFGKFFKFLPQQIRDHLQDRYWTALTP